MPTHVVSFDSLSEVLAYCFHDRDWFFEIILHTDKNIIVFVSIQNNYLSFPSHWNILTFVQYALFHFVQFLWKHNSFMWIFAFRRKKLGRNFAFSTTAICVYFASLTYMQITLHRWILLETKTSPLISHMLAFLGTLFISKYFELHFRLFIPTF